MLPVVRSTRQWARLVRTGSTGVSQRTGAHSSNITTRSRTTSTTTTAKTIQRRRSPAELAALVQTRVAERDAWKVSGVAQGSQPPLGVLLRAMMALQRIQSPSPEELQEFPICPIDWKRLSSTSTNADSQKNETIRVTWLGHASLLIQMNGCNIVTDPVFSDRCSPVSFLGPKRFQPPPCSIQELCENVPVDAILISHNHYDHLDYASLQEFAIHAPGAKIVVPLGLKDWFRRSMDLQEDPPHHDGDQVLSELDWHEQTCILGGARDGKEQPRCEITAVPMRHWSNRVGDRDETLWCGYVISSSPSQRNMEDPTTTTEETMSRRRHPQERRFLFTGDTAWYDDLSTTIGDRYGPFDVAAIPIGAYEPRDFMQYYHMNVDEAVEMKDAVQAAAAVPIHYGTFPLTTEPFLEPAQRLNELMKVRPDSDSFVPWLIGETKTF
jgi:N-acyl-phosphatidylethanolamine-hydrolysing phospholipase D